MIELLISITIFFILSVMTYVNYATYQNIARVKMSLKEVSQSINEARNMAINWYDRNNINQSVWVLYDMTNPNEVMYYWFNFNSWILLTPENIIKIRKLQEWVWVKSLWWKQKILLYFSSIYGEPKIYAVSSTSWLENIDVDTLTIEIAFKNSENYPFMRTLTYFKNTNIVDY